MKDPSLSRSVMKWYEEEMSKQEKFIWDSTHAILELEVKMHEDHEILKNTIKELKGGRGANDPIFLNENQGSYFSKYVRIIKDIILPRLENVVLPPLGKVDELRTERDKAIEAYKAVKLQFATEVSLKEKNFKDLQLYTLDQDTLIVDLDKALVEKSKLEEKLAMVSSLSSRLANTIALVIKRAKENEVDLSDIDLGFHCSP